jgi:hypothetical protein
MALCSPFSDGTDDAGAIVKRVVLFKVQGSRFKVQSFRFIVTGLRFEV